MRFYGKVKISEQTYFARPYENREVLANLKTDSDKNLSLAVSEEMQPLTKYFETFLSVILVSFHLKWNRARSLALQTECTSYLKTSHAT